MRVRSVGACVFCIPWIVRFAAWSTPLSSISQSQDAATSPPSARHGAVGMVPLCVDLDGTLVKSDTLVDSVLALVRQNPRALLSVPGWLAQGKAAFKRHVTSAVTIDVSALPYNHPLLEFLFKEHAATGLSSRSTAPRCRKI